MYLEKGCKNKLTHRLQRENVVLHAETKR